MPRVKIDYVVSFSSEDPEHPASNLLNREVSKKKWLCKKGESSCSVVLQLPRSVKISAVHIGVYHAALVEVLVARSETASDQFQVLVPSSVFLSREESRRAPALQRVRSFSAEQLAAPACQQRWDRVRLVCSQPYNKHCQFGVSFVHVDEFAPVPPRLLALDALGALGSSDEDDFKPGELFAQHRSTAGSPATTTSNTGAQIRQATSQALKNIPESSTKLMKTPISKQNVRRDNTPTTERSADRSRDTLLYTRDDEQPHDRIDTVLQRHKDQKEKDDNSKHTNKPDTKEKDRLNVSSHKVKDEPRNTPKKSRSDTSPKNDSPPSRSNRNNVNPVSDHKEDKEIRKRRRSSSSEKPGPINPEPHTILNGVVLVLSGYENPLRAELRNTALALGARVQRDWGPDCTHLICAFPNTPKLRAARAGAGRVAAARGAWLQQCARRRRRLPWRWFASEPAQRVSPPRHLDTDSEDDTDDEIEKVLQEQKKRRLTDSNTKQTRDVTAANQEDIRTDPIAHDSEDDVATDEESDAAPDTGRFGGALPDFFDGYTFAVDAEPDEAAQMSRYIQAYGGLVIEMSEVEQGSGVDYVVRGGGVAAAGGVRGARVAPAWLARCLAARALLPRRA